MSWLFNVDKTESWAYMPDVFTPEECQKIIDIGLKNKKKQATVSGANNKGQLDLKIRKNSISWLEPYVEDEYDLTWAFLKMATAACNLNEQYFKFDLFGFTEPLQFTEYSSIGDHYVQHVDKVFNGVVRKLSVVVQLSDPKDYEGSELELYYKSNPDIAYKNQGWMTAFPSYTLHKVTPLISGTRYSLVGWISGTPFR